MTIHRLRSGLLLGAALVLGACNAILGIEDVELIEPAATTGVVSTCETGVRDGTETDVDCGGPSCPECALGLGCASGTDCASGFCVEGTCCDDACTAACRTCAGGTCALVAEGGDPGDRCASPPADVCNAEGACRCHDGVKNGDEEGVDCGGSCDRCEGTCDDRLLNNGESSIDCGGARCPGCPDGETCFRDADCAGGACTDADTCCTPEPIEDTCANACGSAVNQCGKTVSCGTTCAPAVPEGWTGPAIVYVGTNPPASCPASYATAGFAGGTEVLAPPATCAPCACDEPVGDQCGTAHLRYFLLGNCSGGHNDGFVNEGGCANVADQTSAGFIAFPVGTVGGSCQPSGGEATLEPVGFVDDVIACFGAQLGTCDAGICVPAPTAPFDLAICVTRPGVEECPAGYEDRIEVLTGIGEDTRACTACSCSNPVGGVCEGTIHVYSDNGCGPLVKNVQTASGCVNTGIVNVHSIGTTLGDPVPGSCPAVGGEAIGEVVGDTPVTVCCTP